MEREVRYCTTKDGVRIGFTVTGSGPPLVYMPQPCMLTLQAREEIEALQAFLLRLEKSFQVIRYDSRGCGLSTRTVDTFDVEALASDVEAIVDKLALDEYFIWAEFDSGPPAIRLAQRYPERVKKLALWCSWARSLDVLDNDTWLALEQIIDQNLQLYLETVTQGMVSGTGMDPRQLVQPLLSGVDQRTVKRAVQSFWSLDVSELLDELTCPCLVLHRQGLFFPVEQSARLAAALPNGRLVVIPGPGGLPWRLGSRPRRTAARYWWRIRCAGCAAARASSSPTEGSSSPKGSRSRCGCMR